MNVSTFGVFVSITPIHALKIEVLGAIWPLNGLQISTKAEKGTPLLESASFESASLKIWRVWPVGEFLKRYKWKKTWLYFTYLSRSPPWSDLNQILHSCCSSRRRNHLWQILWQSVKQCRFCGRSNMEGSHWLSHWLLTLRADATAQRVNHGLENDLFFKTKITD